MLGNQEDLQCSEPCSNPNTQVCSTSSTSSSITHSIVNTQDFKGLREVRLDSPSGSSNSSWSSSIFPSSEITSISSEQILTPLSTWNQPLSTWNQPLSTWNQPLSTWNQPLSTWNQPLSTWNQPLEQDATGAGEDKMVWKETSFLGNEG
uniref:Uncharacterized protein n=1 Tax=Knipowitschia caucasica TaxID=637954 RepID=A0AAV2L9K2_KNICA